jgi:serine/threonine protein kinase
MLTHLHTTHYTSHHTHPTTTTTTRLWLLKDASIRFAPELARQICAALATMHGAGIVHRDIKPDNIMVKAGSCAGPRGVAIKICDFGTAMFTTPSSSTPSSSTTPSTTPSSSSSPAPSFTARRRTTPFVTGLYYRAPELLCGAVEYDGAVDVWSAGCIIAQLFTRRPLFVCGDVVAPVGRRGDGGGGGGGSDKEEVRKMTAENGSGQLQAILEVRESVREGGGGDASDVGDVGDVGDVALPTYPAAWLPSILTVIHPHT